jgi:hypothetical protein
MLSDAPCRQRIAETGHAHGVLRDRLDQPQGRDLAGQMIPRRRPASPHPAKRRGELRPRLRVVCRRVEVNVDTRLPAAESYGVDLLHAEDADQKFPRRRFPVRIEQQLALDRQAGRR